MLPRLQITAPSALSLDRIDPASLAIGFTAMTLLLLGALHALSPEFDPSWRVVSEYANGRFAWVLSFMFACWGVGTWALAVAIRPQIRTREGKVGIGLLYIAGAGNALAAVFDFNQPMHDVAGLLGAAGFPAAAVLIARSLLQTQPALRANAALHMTTKLTWIAVLATVAGVITLFLTFTHAGGHVPADGDPLPLGTVLPAGTIAFAGYANRLMVIANCVWAIVVARDAVGLPMR